MEVRHDVDSLEEVYGFIEKDKESIEILDKIFKEGKQDEAFEIMERRFRLCIPFEWDVRYFIKDELLDAMKNAQ